MSEARGEKINNPTDIRREPANVWIGQSPVQADAAFVSFVDPKYCYRAATKIIMKHYAAGKTTVADVISHWAPPSENNTARYTAAVSKAVGTTALTLPDQLPELLHAITIQEIGHYPYEDATILEGIALAGLKPPEAAPLIDLHKVLAPDPESAPAPQPDVAAPVAVPAAPAAIPWYKSNVIRAVLISVVTQILAHSGVAGKLTTDDIAQVADYILQGAGYVASAWAIYSRTKQPMPTVTLTKKGAQALSTN